MRNGGAIVVSSVGDAEGSAITAEQSDVLGVAACTIFLVLRADRRDEGNCRKTGYTSQAEHSNDVA